MNIQVQTKQSLKEMLIEQAILLEDIMDGEISSEEERKLARLDTELPWKIDSWISVLKKGGTLDFHKDKLKERIEDLKSDLRMIDDEREKKLLYLNGILTELGIERLDGDEFYMKKDISVSTTVDLPSVDLTLRRYTISDLSIDEIIILRDLLLKDLVSGCDFEKDAIDKLVKKIDEAKYTCGVKDLPEGHSALIRKITPTVRFYKRSIKDRKAS